ncbi:hypothetical protein PFISCL1PPCAC_8173, partial [Pristionchus fissidentatus]
SQIASTMLRSLFLLLLVCAVAYTASSDETDDVTSGKHHGRNHHRNFRRHRHHHPEFLKGLSKGTQDDYYKIFEKNSTKAEIKKNVMEWARKSGVEKAVTEANEKREKFFDEHNKNVTEAIPKLAEAQSKILSILKDDSLTHAQSWEKVKASIKDYSPQLKAMLWAMKPHHGHRGGRGGNGGRRTQEKKGGDKKQEEEETKEEEEDEEEEEKNEEKYE